MTDRKVLEVRLVCLGEGDGIPERRVVLAADQDVIVGRASSNRGVAASADNTKINNPVISKEHAAFTTNPTGTVVFIKDLGSMHGTRVNERELSQGQECQISSGSTLQFGSAVIRGNVTYQPAKYSFYADPVNHTTPFSSVIPTCTISQSQAFSDTKKGYGDDSSLYSDDYDYDDDMEEDDYTSNNEQADVTMVPDTYSSEQESDASPDDSVDSSSEGSVDESEGSDDMSVEEYCPLESVVDTELPAVTSSTIAVADESSFCSPYLEGSEILGQRTSSVQPSGPSMAVDMGVSNGEWPEYSEVDHSIYLTSTSNPWTSEAADNFNFNIDTEEPSAMKKFNLLQAGANKSRPFSNSINDLCEPAPEADTIAPGLASAVADTVTAKTTSTSGITPTAQSKPSVGNDVNMEGMQRLIDEVAASIKAHENGKTETARGKRTVSEAELDTEDMPNVTEPTKAAQAATPQQMSNRRIASFTRRARDFSIGAVVGGVALFTLLAAAPDVV